jgi:hypothetical protein
MPYPNPWANMPTEVIPTVPIVSFHRRGRRSAIAVNTRTKDRCSAVGTNRSRASSDRASRDRSLLRLREALLAEG